MQRSLILAIFVYASVSACTPIRPYPLVIPLPAETLIPPSAQLDVYTMNPVTQASAGLTVQFTRTTQHCGVVKQAIANEIHLREQRLSSRGQALLLIGSLAALGTTVYSSVTESPRKEIVVPLSLVSGSSLVTALPTLGKDERINALRDAVTAIRSKEASAIAALHVVERSMLDVALLEDRRDREAEGGEERTRLQGEINKKYVELAPQEEALRTALALLANECS